MRVSAGVVISASHNPYYDNGIKIFFADGFKISSQEEKKIEELGFFQSSQRPQSGKWDEPRRISRCRRPIYRLCKKQFPQSSNSLKGIKIVLGLR